MRTFKVPKIKWNASNLHELIDWSDEIYEPIITCEMSSETLKNIINAPLEPVVGYCHTQSCERAVKDLTRASELYGSYWKRHISTLAKIESRKYVKKSRH